MMPTFPEKLSHPQEYAGISVVEEHRYLDGIKQTQNMPRQKLM